MAVADTAKLLVDLSLKGNFASQISKAGKAARGFDKDASRAYKAGSQIGTGIKRGAVIAAAGVGVLVTQIGFGLDQLIELESLTAQTNAVLKSTRSVAGQTAASIRNLAEKYEGLNATIDDKVIQSGENLLLTFTNIGKKAFEPTLKAALDMSTALGTDLNAAIKTVGKALSEPDKAMARLRRQGIILTKSEEKQIKAHLKNNDTLGAQNDILRALQKRYGGSFLAGGNTTAGKVAKFGDAIEDIQKTLATAMLPAVSNIADALNDLFRDPEVLDATKRLGEDIGALFSKENIGKGINFLKSGVSILKEAVGAIGGVVRTVADAFAALPAPLQQALVGGFVVNKLTGGLVTNIFGGIAEAIAKSFIRAPLVNVQGGVVNVGGGVPGAGVPGAGVPLGVIAGVAGAAALGSKAVADFTNADFSNAGFSNVDFEAPGGGPFGITSLVHNVQQLIGVLGQRPVIRDDRHLDRPSTVGPAADKQRQATEKVQTSVETMKGKLADDLAEAKMAIDRTKSQVSTSGSVVAGAERVGSSSIVSAIYANRPITNVNVNISATQVTRTVEVTNRYGTQSGSRNTDATTGNTQADT